MQVIINLISNSIKFTSKGYIKVGASYDRYNNVLMMFVEDTGVGIKPEDIEKLFVIFGKL
jgi:signal transduction histidine kinase